MTRFLRKLRIIGPIAAVLAAVADPLGVRLDLVILAVMAVVLSFVYSVMPVPQQISVDQPRYRGQRADSDDPRRPVVLSDDSGIDQPNSAGPARSDATAITWWNSRLAWLQNDPSAFASRIQPRLATMIDTRLRLRHGFDYAGDPQRAQLILGPELSAICAGPVAQVPTPGALAAMVDRIEQL